MTSAVVVRRWLIAPARSRRELLPVLVAGLVFLAILAINIIRRIGSVPDDVGAILVAAKDLAPAAIPVALLIGFYRQSEQRLRAVVDAIPDRMFRFARDGRYLDVPGDASGARRPVRTDWWAGRLHDLMFATVSGTALAAAGRALDSGQTAGVRLLARASRGPARLRGPDRAERARRGHGDRPRLHGAARDGRRAAPLAGEDRRGHRCRAAPARARPPRRRPAAAGLAVARAPAPAVAARRPGRPERRGDRRGRRGGRRAQGRDQGAARARPRHPPGDPDRGRPRRRRSRRWPTARPVPTVVSSLPDRRLPAAVEATAYFVVSEALANVAKYASATRASVGAELRRGHAPRRGRRRRGRRRGPDARDGDPRAPGPGRGARWTPPVDSPAGQGTLVVAEIPIA